MAFNWYSGRVAAGALALSQGAAESVDTPARSRRVRTRSGHDGTVDVEYVDLDMSPDEVVDRDGVETSLVEHD